MKRNGHFERYQNLLRRIAWSFHYTTGIEWDDLYSEACLAYVKAMQEYNPARAKLVTWLQHAVTNHLISYAKNQRHFRPAGMKLSHALRVTPEDVLCFRAALLPKAAFPWRGYFQARDMRKAVQVVLNNPAHYAGVNGRKRLHHSLRKLGWNTCRIKRTFAALQAAL